VTGGTGFIGRNLIPLLIKSGHEVVLLARSDRFLETFSVDGVATVSGDLLDRGSLEAAVSLTRPDAILHMAAVTPVRESWRDPRAFMETNYFGTINLVESVKRAQPSAIFIHYSTPEVLRPAESLRELGEGSDTYPTSPYAASKLAAESYVRYSGLRSVVLRPANTYDRSSVAGVEEARGYFVEKAIIGVLTSDKVEFDGSSQSVRTWMHVSDHVKATSIIVNEADRYVGRIVHIAPPNSTASCLSVYTAIVEKALEEGLINRVPRSTWLNRPRPFDPQYLAVRGSPINGWSPMSLEEGLRAAVKNWARVLGVA